MAGAATRCVAGLVIALIVHVATAAASSAENMLPGDSLSCHAAAAAAEARYALPPGLLLAIGKVESGRPMAATGAVEPWPWTANAHQQGVYFPNKDAAKAWIRAEQASGDASIDVGCFQVNLFYHPAAFADVDAALDPVRNADYAARFLVALHARFGDWGQATGAYHSETAGLAQPYRRRVALAFGAGPPPPPPPPVSTLDLLRQAWGATLPQDEKAPAIAAAPAATRRSAAMLARLPAQADAPRAQQASVRTVIWAGH